MISCKTDETESVSDHECLIMSKHLPVNIDDSYSSIMFVPIHRTLISVTLVTNVSISVVDQQIK